MVPRQVDDHGDLRVIGNSEPRFNFGLHLGADWKGFDVQMFFQGVLKRDLWLSGPLFWGADGGEWQSVGYEEHLDYWRPQNTTSIFGRTQMPTTRKLISATKEIKTN